MDDEPYLIDFDTLLVQLLKPALPGVLVSAGSDTETVATLPAVIITPGPGNGITDAPEGYGYTSTVSLVIVGTSRAAAFTLADKAHRAMHSLPGAAVEGVGRVGAVTNQIAPRRTGTSKVGKTSATEYLATYGVEATH
ncbi:MAG TPA: hypothetical protein VF885_26650 [Arthrobacter sp.]